MENVEVRAEVGPAALDPDAAAERRRLDAVPGGTNLIQPQQELRLATLKDALGYQPGLVVQEFFGGLDQPRLNVRGSGIQSNPVNRGVLLLEDGLPLNEADGSFVIGFLEPRNARLVSVRRGANALAAGATTLGGELDFISLTGTEGEIARLEGGSFGRTGAQLAKGLNGEGYDGRIGLSHDRYDGYRHHSASTRSAMTANFGMDGERFENRTYLSYVDLDLDIPFVVTREQLNHDPRQLNGEGVPVSPPFSLINIQKRDPHRSSSQFRVANRTRWGSGMLNSTLGLYAQTIDDDFQDPMSAAVSSGSTWGIQWQLAGTRSNFDYRLAIDWAYSSLDRDLYTVDRDTGQRKVQYGRYDLSPENRNALLAGTWRLASSWTLVADAKLSRSSRDARDRVSGMALRQSWNYVSPTMGMIWQPLPGQRLFANLSRSNEAPTYWEIINGGDGPTSLPNPMNDSAGSSGLSKLKLQRARTIEVGGDGSLADDALRWSLALYRSEVTDELMSVSTANGTAAGTYNYRGGTRHEGVELGLGGHRPWSVAALDWRLAYTLGDFHFKDGEYAGNRIAGVPRQILSAELMVHVGGVRFGPNVYWMPQSTPTNHANTPGTQQDPFALLGFKLDCQLGRNWQAYVQGDNLTNRTHASAFVIRDIGTSAMPTFLPGNGRGFSVGFSHAF